MKYPAINAYKEHWLDVGDGHQLYIAEYGNPIGKPIVYLHGGPGGGTTPAFARYYDPAYYRVILFDQRGCGRSKPWASVEHNTIPLLTDDVARVLDYLQIEKAMFHGGSWGSALALFFAERYAHRVQRLLLRGVFFADREGADRISDVGPAVKYAPDYFAAYQAFAAANGHTGLLREAYNSMLAAGPDDPTALEAHRLFDTWDVAIGYPTVIEALPAIESVNANPRSDFALSRCFFHFCVTQFSAAMRPRLLSLQQQLKDIKIDIIHGEQDWICPVENAHLMKAAYPEQVTLHLTKGGHMMSIPENAAALCAVTDSWRLVP